MCRDVSRCVKMCSAAKCTTIPHKKFVFQNGCGKIVSMVEHWSPKPKVQGSNPFFPAHLFHLFFPVRVLAVARHTSLHISTHLDTSSMCHRCVTDVSPMCYPCVIDVSPCTVFKKTYLDTCGVSQRKVRILEQVIFTTL